MGSETRHCTSKPNKHRVLPPHFAASFRTNQSTCLGFHLIGQQRGCAMSLAVSCPTCVRVRTAHVRTTDRPSPLLNRSSVPLLFTADCWSSCRATHPSWHHDATSSPPVHRSLTLPLCSLLTSTYFSTRRLRGRDKRPSQHQAKSNLVTFVIVINYRIIMPIVLLHVHTSLISVPAAILP